MRDLQISLLNPRTERDAQVEVGASNLSNPCDHCRAWEISGVERGDRIMDQAWGGRVIGTAIHKHVQNNVETAVATASEVGDDLAQLGYRYPGMQAERHMTLGELLPGRVVTSSTDLYLPSQSVLVDVKNSTQTKLAYIRDALSMIRGTGPIFGRDHRFTIVFEESEVMSGAKKGQKVWRKAKEGVSERVYATEIAHAHTKIERYSRQLSLYGMGIVNEGLPVDQLFINMICRDSAMTTDNRESERYMDQNAPRGVVSIAFVYNHEYAVGLWKEAQAMAKALDDGSKTPSDYMPHPHCIVCTSEVKHDAKLEATAPGNVDFAALATVDPWAEAAAKLEATEGVSA
jgi:hypothetical protein